MKREETFTFVKGLPVHQVIDLVHATERWDSYITFETKKASANGKSALGLMSMLTTLKLGEKVTVKANGEDATEVINGLKTFFERSELTQEPLDYWEEAGVETVEAAMTGCLTAWSDDVQQIAKSYLKTTRS
ncbi:phosphotransferase system HPr (HPr) family protein [Salsuginibacillus halophilus]|uniref:Phosphotransferase system HPr (HPr) family protein n=1 Tax=Salsuginibacillus halophilus TaxID=517424 RepID=A0A2P8HXB2_9BACI|nr:HPr family phosphocarrier protein [Salsuginibacillus halophilus]PSL50871.1 phosphotransferase system HPr (HPr) family protein [Salsuginibacillus halophilus]